MRLLISDDSATLDFAPLTLTRPIAELRMGLMTIRERWIKYLDAVSVGYITADHLSKRYPNISADITVNARVLPNAEIVSRIKSLQEGEELVASNTWIARRGDTDRKVEYAGHIMLLAHRWDLFQFNNDLIKTDFELITSGRTSVQLSSTNTVIGDPNMVFLEEGAHVEAAILNTKEGPIYIGKCAEVMEGSMIRGPLAILDHASTKMGAKIYGGTTIGPYCKIGGEVSNSIFYAYSNKGHDGFVGNSLIGEWCNLGADTNTSNLKNNYGKVKTYDFRTKNMIQTDVTFMGLSMGDHSKSSINTMFNTASVTGVFTNVFQAGFPDKYLPSFSWGAKEVRFELSKALASANAMMARRNKQLDASEIEIFEFLFKAE